MSGSSRRIYVASSWRNGEHQQRVVGALRAAGHDVYDFRNPEIGNTGFSWTEIDEDFGSWTPAQFAAGLQHPIARYGFELDMTALAECEVCVLVLPCGRSAHLEIGYAAGTRKRTIVYAPDGAGVEPELMYLMCDAPMVTTLPDLLAAIAEPASDEALRAVIAAWPVIARDVPATSALPRTIVGTTLILEAPFDADLDALEQWCSTLLARLAHVPNARAIRFLRFRLSRRLMAVGGLGERGEISAGGMTLP